MRCALLVKRECTEIEAKCFVVIHGEILAEVKKKALKKRRTLQSSALKIEASEGGGERGIGCLSSLVVTATNCKQRYL